MRNRNMEKIWTKDFVSIAMTQFLVFITFYTLLTTLPIYVIQQLQGNNSEGGLVVTVMLLAAILMRPFSPKILEIVGKKKGLVIGVVTFTISNFLYLWIDQFVPLLIVRLIQGFSFGFLTTVTGAIVADIVPKSRRGAGLGYFAMAMNLALVVGPFLGLSLLEVTTFENLFIVLNILLVIAVFSSFLVKIPAHAEYTEKVTSFKLKPSDLLEKKAVPIALISGLVGMAYASIMSFISVYAKTLGLSVAASYFFLVFAIVMLASRPFVGRAFDSRGPKFVLSPSLFIFAVGLLCLSFTSTPLVLLFAAALVGLGYGSMLPGLQTMAIQSAKQERSGHATATFFIFYDLGIGVGSFVWGLVASGVGFSNMYLITAILVFATFVIFNQYVERRRKAEAKEKQKLALNVQESR